MELSDEAILESVFEAFADAATRRLILDRNHCSECATAETFLLSLDPRDLSLAEIGDQAGYDYFSMLTDEGFRYFIPGLCRVALAERPHGIWHLLARFESRVSIITEAHHRNALREFLDYFAAMGYAESDSDRKSLRRIRDALHEPTQVA